MRDRSAEGNAKRWEEEGAGKQELCAAMPAGMSCHFIILFRFSSRDNLLELIRPFPLMAPFVEPIEN